MLHIHIRSGSSQSRYEPNSILIDFGCSVDTALLNIASPTDSLLLYSLLSHIFLGCKTICEYSICACLLYTPSSITLSIVTLSTLPVSHDYSSASLLSFFPVFISFSLSLPPFLPPSLPYSLPPSFLFASFHFSFPPSLTFSFPPSLPFCLSCSKMLYLSSALGLYFPWDFCLFPGMYVNCAHISSLTVHLYSIFAYSSIFILIFLMILPSFPPSLP